MSKTYELIYIIKPTLSDEQYAVIHEKVRAAVEKNGGQIIGEEKWGIKKLATVFAKFSQGFYVMITFEGNNAVTVGINKALNVNEDIIRYIVTNKIGRPKETVTVSE